ncbi:MAG: hypothetical protein HOQ22_01515, partial [Nocardioidaceae bacterium]|nr:hypothetical protein [Nocardioidaceae bacterium]
MLAVLFTLVLIVTCLSLPGALARHSAPPRTWPPPVAQARIHTWPPPTARTPSGLPVPTAPNRHRWWALSPAYT